MPCDKRKRAGFTVLLFISWVVVTLSSPVAPNFGVWLLRLFYLPLVFLANIGIAFAFGGGVFAIVGLLFIYGVSWWYCSRLSKFLLSHDRFIVRGKSKSYREHVDGEGLT